MKTQSHSLAIIAISLVMLIFQVSVVGQNTTNPTYPRDYNINKIAPAGQHQGNGNGGSPAYNPTDNEYLFGYSGYMNNPLVLNGIEVPCMTSGWYYQGGLHDNTNSNYFCGFNYSTYNGYFRDFLAYDLSNLLSYGISLPITSAAINVFTFDFYFTTPTLLWQLSEVTATYSEVNQSYNYTQGGIDIFTDLGDGTSYGSHNFLLSENNNWISVPLNAAAIAAINDAAGSTFIIGGKADEMAPPLETPVSNWALGIGIFLIVAFTVVRFRKLI